MPTFSLGLPQYFYHTVAVKIFKKQTSTLIIFVHTWKTSYKDRFFISSTKNRATSFCSQWQPGNIFPVTIYLNLRYVTYVAYGCQVRPTTCISEKNARNFKKMPTHVRKKHRDQLNHHNSIERYKAWLHATI